jgi:hypothetical protein
MSTRVYGVIFAGVVAVAAVVACGGSSGVTFSARAGAPAGAAPATALVTSGEVTISQVQLVIRRVRLEGFSGTDGGADGGATDGGVTDGGTTDGGVDGELSVGPFVIDLSGDALGSGRVSRVFQAPELPAGTYRKIKFKIHKVEDSDAAASAALAALNGKSVVVSGTYGGAPFTFSSSLDEEQEREGTFTLGNGNDNITLDIDPSRWFVGAGGATLDPSSSANRSQIESNIKASIDVFDDDDRDGRDD